jgi:exopolysaccharide biosynthesis polyprenyl glycosylphosphotransferase
MIDALIAGSLMVGVFVIANLESAPEGIGSFMKARVSVGNAIMGVAFLLIFHLFFRLLGIYNAVQRSFRQEILRVFAASSLASIFALLFPAMSKTHSFGWPLVLYFWVWVTVATITVRAVGRILTKYIGPQPREVIIVGSGQRALNLYQEIQKKAPREYRVLGFVDSPNAHSVADEIQSRMLGSIQDLDTILMKRVVDHVMIALPIKSRYDDIQRSISVCEQAGVESEVLSDVFDVSVARAQRGNFGTRPIVRYKVVKDDYRLSIKRLIDLSGAAVGLIFFAPVMLIVAIAVALTSPGSVLFAQERYGMHKRRFRMLKFRTMVSGAEKLQASLESSNEAQGPVFKIHNDPRITPLGRFLRKTSLDELPQLFNVLSGEMSLVGPRPLPKRDVSLFDDPSLMRRFSVKPGLTCLWQVTGRSSTDFDHWIALDLKYIDEWSLLLDVAILAKTIPAVVRGNGAA